jgi:hypothetical protein
MPAQSRLAQPPLTAVQLLNLFNGHAISEHAQERIREFRQVRSLRATRNFLLMNLYMNLQALLTTQTPRTLLDLITELGLFSCLKSLLKFLRVTHRKRTIGRIPWNQRQKIYEFFFADAEPNKNMFVAFCALKCLLDFDEAALGEQERNERKAILSIMNDSLLREDIFGYLQMHHGNYLLTANEVFSPTDELFQQSFDNYCKNFLWFVVVNTHIRNHRRFVIAAPEPELELEQPPAAIV